MTEEKRDDIPCPVCGSETVHFWSELSTRICSTCSVVLDGTEITNVSDVHPEASSPENPDRDTTSDDWKDHVLVADNSEAILVDVLSQTEAIGDTLTLSDEVVLRAGEIVTEAWKSNFMHGRTTEDTIAGAMYAACREVDCAVPPGKLANVAGTDKRSLKQTYSQLKDSQELNLGPPIPEEYLGYICEELDLSPDVNVKAKRLLRDSDNTAGDPAGIAAAGVYEIAKNQPANVTLREAASAAVLTKETVWRHTQIFESV